MGRSPIWNIGRGTLPANISPYPLYTEMRALLPEYALKTMGL